MDVRRYGCIFGGVVLLLLGVVCGLDRELLPLPLLG